VLQFTFILNEPAVPENIGFSVRALKTMGFSAMRIVNGANHTSKQTRKTAYGSHDLLESVTTFNTLEEALDDMDIVIGTTSKKRTSRDEIILARELPDFIKSKGRSIRKVGVVFGSEESGLSKEQLALCDVVSTIPLATKYPSLNLAQSVLIYAWELSGLSTKKKSPDIKGEDEALQKKFIVELDSLFHRLEINRAPAFHQKIRDRAQFLPEKDVKLVLSVLGKIRRLLS